MNMFYGILCIYLAGAIITWGLAYVHYSKKTVYPMKPAVVVGIVWVYGLFSYIIYRLKGCTRTKG